MVVFLSQNPPSKGIVNMLVAAVLAVFNAIWGAFTAETSKRAAQAEKWRDENGIEVDK